MPQNTKNRSIVGPSTPPPGGMQDTHLKTHPCSLQCSSRKEDRAGGLRRHHGRQALPRGGVGGPQCVQAPIVLTPSPADSRLNLLPLPGWREELCREQAGADLSSVPVSCLLDTFSQVGLLDCKGSTWQVLKDSTLFPTAAEPTYMPTNSARGSLLSTSSLSQHHLCTRTSGQKDACPCPGRQKAQHSVDFNQQDVLKVETCCPQRGLKACTSAPQHWLQQRMRQTRGRGWPGVGEAQSAAASGPPGTEPQSSLRLGHFLVRWVTTVKREGTPQGPPLTTHNGATPCPASRHL